MSPLRSLTLSHNELSSLSWKMFVDKMQIKPKYMRGIDEPASWDYNRYRKYFTQNNQLQELNIVDAGLESANLMKFCIALQFCDYLQLSHVDFGRQGILDSPSIDVPGCPYPVSAYNDVDRGLLSVANLHELDRTPAIMFLIGMSALLAGFITLAFVSLFHKNKCSCRNEIYNRMTSRFCMPASQHFSGVFNLLNERILPPDDISVNSSGEDLTDDQKSTVSLDSL